MILARRRRALAPAAPGRPGAGPRQPGPASTAQGAWPPCAQAPGTARTCAALAAAAIPRPRRPPAAAAVAAASARGGRRCSRQVLSDEAGANVSGHFGSRFARENSQLCKAQEIYAHLSPKTAIQANQVASDGEKGACTGWAECEAKPFSRIVGQDCMRRKVFFVTCLMCSRSWMPSLTSMLPCSSPLCLLGEKGHQ
jgi:hypothetical protein